MSFSVDGNLEFDGDVSFPFPTSDSGPRKKTAESSHQWVLGLGFKGLISSFAFYPDNLDAVIVKLIYDQGPHMHSLAQGVKVPQTSFDSAHTILGTQISKGQTALRAARAMPAFCINANCFQSDVKQN